MILQMSASDVPHLHSQRIARFEFIDCIGVSRSQHLARKHASRDPEF